MSRALRAGLLALATIGTFGAEATADVGSVSKADSAYVAGHEAHRKHVSLGIGMAKYVNENFPSEDLDRTILGHAGFRYMVKSGLDAVLDFRLTHASEDVAPDLTYPAGSTVFDVAIWSGVGIRMSKPGMAATRPYAQAALYFIDEQRKQEYELFENSERRNGLGLGLVGGVEMPVGEHIWIPVELSVLTGSTQGGLTAVGVNAGLTFGFGRAP